MGEIADMDIDAWDFWGEEDEEMVDNRPEFGTCRICKKEFRWIRKNDKQWRLMDKGEYHWCLDPKIIEEFPIVEGV